MTTTTHDEVLEQIEQFRAEQQYSIDLGEAVNRLINNPDFKLVFTDHIFDIRLKRLVEELATTSAEPLLRKAEANVRAIGLLKVMIKEIITEANQAKYNQQASDDAIINHLNGGE